ncbi:divergent polysaccharide deacetylase family protein [Thermodesulfobacteriota bacterium]
MTKKKRGSPKRKSSKGRGLQKTDLKRAVYGIIILFVLVIGAGFAVHYLFLPRKPPPKKLPVVERSSHKPTVVERPSHKSPVVERPKHKPPVYEIFPKEKSPIVPKPVKPKSQKPSDLPKVAIIIDDMGYDRKLANRFLELDAVFTFSVLPHSPFQHTIAKAARKKGFETMLHLPMEPLEYPRANPGPGALLSSMTPDELIRQLEKNLSAVPFIKGVNNHMGSKMTANSTQLHQIFSVFKKKGVFFIDSRTTKDTLCKPSAHLFQVPFGERNVFLDHIPKPDYIRKQLNLLVRIAQHDGVAIGIAHPHTVTYNVLREMIPDLNKKVRLTPASQMVGQAG